VARKIETGSLLFSILDISERKGWREGERTGLPKRSDTTIDGARFFSSERARGVDSKQHGHRGHSCAGPSRRLCGSPAKKTRQRIADG